MTWDLGPVGVAVLIGMSLAFGVVAQLVAGRHTTRWMWLVGTVSFFVIGLLISEWWFGWATSEDLQPNYDGLSFDETLLALVPCLALVLVARHRVRRNRQAPE